MMFFKVDLGFAGSAIKYTVTGYRLNLPQNKKLWMGSQPKRFIRKLDGIGPVY